MTEKDACFICTKHRDLPSYTGVPLAEESGMVLTHFPVIEGVPATRGHLLIEPRRHITELTEMSEEESVALGRLLRTGADRLKRELAPEHVYVFRINDKVPHLHFHLIPRYPGTPREYYGQRIMEYAGSPKLLLSEIHALSGLLATPDRDSKR